MGDAVTAYCNRCQKIMPFEADCVSTGGVFRRCAICGYSQTVMQKNTYLVGTSDLQPLDASHWDAVSRGVRMRVIDLMVGAGFRPNEEERYATILLMKHGDELAFTEALLYTWPRLPSDFDCHGFTVDRLVDEIIKYETGGTKT